MSRRRGGELGEALGRFDIVLTFNVTCFVFMGVINFNVPYVFRMVANLRYPKYNVDQVFVTLTDLSFGSTFRSGTLVLYALPMSLFCVTQRCCFCVGAKGPGCAGLRAMLLMVTLILLVVFNVLHGFPSFSFLTPWCYVFCRGILGCVLCFWQELFVSEVVAVDHRFSDNKHRLNGHLTSRLKVPYCSHRVISVMTRRRNLSGSCITGVSRESMGVFCSSAVKRNFADCGFNIDRSLRVTDTRRGLVGRLTTGNSYIVVNHTTSIVLRSFGPLGLFICTSVSSGVTHYGTHGARGRTLASHGVGCVYHSVSHYHTGCHRVFASSG